MSDEWVSGDKVDFDGLVEVRSAGSLTVRPSLIDKGKYWNSQHDKWMDVATSWCSFRRVTPDPELIKDGERWRKLDESDDPDTRCTIRKNGTRRIFDFNGTDIGFRSDADLDAYLAEPKRPKITVTIGDHTEDMELLSAIEVDGFRVTVERIE